MVLDLTHLARTIYTSHQPSDYYNISVLLY